MSTSTIQFVTQTRVSCNLPIDTVKAKKELHKRLHRHVERKKPELSQQQLNMDDAQALSSFIFQG
ncbi:hypothetical protein KXJ72_17935 (plasmid) [Comamonas aquatica]|nr:hypothetical protein KXJ72_17935 [Comamonas aquatica]